MAAKRPVYWSLQANEQVDAIKELRDRRLAYGRACCQWREMRGISQEAMPPALGLHDAQAVSRLENGHSPWTLTA